MDERLFCCDLISHSVSALSLDALLSLLLPLPLSYLWMPNCLIATAAAATRTHICEPCTLLA